MLQPHFIPKTCKTQSHYILKKKNYISDMALNAFLWWFNWLTICHQEAPSHGGHSYLKTILGLQHIITCLASISCLLSTYKIHQTRTRLRSQTHTLPYNCIIFLIKATIYYINMYSSNDVLNQARTNDTKWTLIWNTVDYIKWP